MGSRRRFRFHSLRTKLVLAFLVSVLPPLIGTGLYGNWTTSRTLEAQALHAARADLRLRAQQIKGYLDGAREDLLFISRLESLAGLLAADRPHPSLLASVQSEFAAFAATHPGMFQTRYLDAAGMEVVRVDRTSGGVDIVPADRQKDKADRYYLEATMRLPAGEVYVSELDLNRELGVIQVPHTPTIRYATPVFRPDGSRAGIVILNLLAEPFLRFARTDATSDALLALVDDSGYYLAHPHPAREWGGPKDRHTGASAAVDYPRGWIKTARQPAGVFSPPPENWLTRLADEVLPMGIIPTRDGGVRRVLVHESIHPAGPFGPRWILLYDAPHVSLFASVWIFRLTAIAVLSAAALGALGMAFGLARGLTAPVLALADDVRRFGQDTLAQAAQRRAPAGDRAHDEIEELTAAFRDMSAALAERQTELQALVEKLIAAQEEERRVVAYDIHDGLIQMLVGARLQLRNFAADRERDPERAEAELHKGLDQLGAAVGEARRVIEGLRPAALDHLGLVATLRQVAEEIRATCGCELAFVASPPDLRASSLVETTAFRIAQEAMTNARKYSVTQRLRIAIGLTDGALTVEVSDWGRGFDPSATAGGRGVGLMAMRERARLLGGECLIESAPGAGTTVRATLPLNPPRGKR